MFLVIPGEERICPAPCMFNRLYAVGIALSLLMGGGLALALNTESLKTALPMLFLFTLGGTSLLYVLGLVVFEKDEGTLFALLVSPLTTHEYFMSKLISLTGLALLESLIIVGITGAFTTFSPVFFVGGVLLMGVMLTLMGFILIVRYNTLTDAFLPLLVVGLGLNLPALYFLDIVPNALILLVPSSAPTMLSWGAWHPLEAWEVAYGVGYSLLLIAGLYRWAMSAFYRHITLKGG